MAEECCESMFQHCTSLTTTPVLPATTLAPWCYSRMFYECSSLTSLPELPAKNLPIECYYQMFCSCSSIKLSETQTWDYQAEYIIPSTWDTTGSHGNNCINNMFLQTGWTFVDTPTLGRTYYTSNNIIS
jgi:hypothetical protein